MDINGDGVVAPDTEAFNLALVANGLDGTLQFYRVPSSGDPVLLSAVRFAGADTSGVKLDRAERLAYVGLGARGVAIVDLAGPASVQPIDADHNGLDDRVLGIIEAAGSATRIALDLPRGLGFAANGSSGLRVLQLLPARTTLLSLKRDPVRAATGDEEEILESRRAATTDDAFSCDCTRPCLWAGAWRWRLRNQSSPTAGWSPLSTGPRPLC